MFIRIPYRAFHNIELSIDKFYEVQNHRLTYFEAVVKRDIRSGLSDEIYPNPSLNFQLNPILRRSSLFFDTLILACIYMHTSIITHPPILRLTREREDEHYSQLVEQSFLSRCIIASGRRRLERNMVLARKCSNSSLENAKYCV